MGEYFLRRFLLLILTFLGITFITFFILQISPGGPMELEIMKLRGGQTVGESAISGRTTTYEIPQSVLNEMKRFYGFDKPILERYWIWLKNLLTFDLGRSYSFNHEPVWDVIVSRFPISLRFGIAGFVLSYLLCIPLGIYKAVKHGSKFDMLTSVIVFVGYSIPGWAMGVLLLVFFGGGSFLSIFPLGGVVSDNYESLSFIGKIIDSLHHMILPVTSYVISSFAILTILTKNSVLDNLSRDYVRTAYAKGLTPRRVLLKHVFRNSLIPIATGFGHFFSVLLAGSVLIETVFNIDGIGLLSYKAILYRDYPVTMGLLVIQSLLVMIGNIFSDILYALIDPRIRFK